MTSLTCGKKCIRQMGTKVTNRVWVSQATNQRSRNMKCSIHFLFVFKFYTFPFKKVKKENEQFRKAKEKYYVILFNPKLNC